MHSYEITESKEQGLYNADPKNRLHGNFGFL